MQSPELMYALDYTRAGIWELGREYADLGTEVMDCHKRGCGGKDNHHPWLTQRGETLYHQITDDKIRAKIIVAFNWSHFLFGHDIISSKPSSPNPYPTCDYCYRDGPWTPQDEYIREYDKRKDPNYYERQYENQQQLYSKARSVPSTQKPKIEKVLEPITPKPNETMAEYIKRDTQYMKKLGNVARAGFKERFAQMNQIFEAEQAKFKNLTES